MGRAIESTAGKKTKPGSSSFLGARSAAKRGTSRRPKHTGLSTKTGTPASGSIPYEPDLLKDLQDSGYAKAYLASCLKDDHPGTFFVALRQVVQARGGLTKAAKQLHLNRPGLYRALSEKGNPSMQTVMAVLSALGLHFEIGK